MKIVQALIRDERGFVVSSELVVIATLLVIGIMSGLQVIQSSVVGEMHEISRAVRSLDQSYSVNTGAAQYLNARARRAFVQTSRYVDQAADSQGLVYADNLKRIEPRDGDQTFAPADINAYPWIMVPDCLSCRSYDTGPCYGNCARWDGCSQCGTYRGYGRTVGACGSCGPFSLTIENQPSCGCDLVPAVPARVPCYRRRTPCETCGTGACGLPGPEMARYISPGPSCAPCGSAADRLIW